MPDSIFTFFGLHENPFRINPDPRFQFVTDQTRATADELVYAIRNRKGLISLIGEVGTGKTMLVRRLLDWLADQKMPTALVFNSQIRPEHLLDFILHDFGVPCDSPVKSDKLMALNQWLLERYRAGQTPVLVVDEAQGLQLETLEEVRLLMNFETPREKLLQIVLAGQPELDAKLRRHELRQLRQRITMRCRTVALTPDETAGYIEHRLRVAGAKENTFEPDALTAVHVHSQGIPRLINVLCEHAMINACADGSHTVPRAAVDQAARDCQLDRAESVARILQTGSYSASELRDEINSLLAATSARATPSQKYAPATGIATTPPARAVPAAPPLPYLSAYERSFPDARPYMGIDTGPLAKPDSTDTASILAPMGSRGQCAAAAAAAPALERPAPAAASVANPPSRNQQEIETIALPPIQRPLAVPGVPHATNGETQDVELQPAEATRVSDAHATDQELLQQATASARTPKRRPPESFRELLAFWGAGFAHDARLTVRHTWQWLRGLEMKYWQPVLRSIRRQTRQAELRTVRFLSDPRWAQRRRVWSSSVNRQWMAAKSATLAKLDRLAGAEPDNADDASRSKQPRTMRLRAVTSLRRWLHQPMNAERKSARRHRTA